MTVAVRVYAWEGETEAGSRARFLAFRIGRKLAFPLSCGNDESQMRSWVGRVQDMDSARAKSPRNGKTAQQGSSAETINFKVPSEFKREFKGYAATQGLSMVELLREGFELSKQKRK